MAALELEDIQGLVTFGYGHLEYAAYLFLNMADAVSARAWLAQIALQVTPARSDKGTEAVHIAFTIDGLKQIGLPDDGLTTFPRQFQEGMALPDRARILGDVGDEDPSQWQFGGPSNDPLHVLLMLFAHTTEARQALIDQHQAALTANGLRILHQENSERPRKNEEHFGFRDGLSQPAIDGSPVKAKPGQTLLPPGEFILGYEDAYAQMPFAPTVVALTDPSGLLKPDPVDTGRLSLGRNGSYLVFRKLQQHVGAFWGYFRAQAEASSAPDHHEEMLRLASKGVGRWRSGAPLTLSPDQDNKQPDNVFGFRALDPNGERCPYASHIRRSNPRDVLTPDPFGGQPEDNTETINHHRILRRGRPYGSCLIHPETDPDDGADRGLLFLTLNANIRRQFEFVQQTWINNPNFGGLYNDRDPLLGSDPEATLTIPGSPLRTRLCKMPQFITMRGGAYFFLPGLAALRYLAQLD